MDSTYGGRTSRVRTDAESNAHSIGLAHHGLLESNANSPEQTTPSPGARCRAFVTGIYEAVTCTRSWGSSFSGLWRSLRPVPRPEDIGTDAFVTLVRPDGSRRLLPDVSCLVQLKAASVSVVPYDSPDAVNWVRNLEIPLFIGRVSLPESRIELFTTQRLHQILLEGHHDSIHLLLDPAAESDATPGVRPCPPRPARPRLVARRCRPARVPGRGTRCPPPARRRLGPEPPPPGYPVSGVVPMGDRTPSSRGRMVSFWVAGRRYRRDTPGDGTAREATDL